MKAGERAESDSMRVFVSALRLLFATVGEEEMDEERLSDEETFLIILT